MKHTLIQDVKCWKYRITGLRLLCLFSLCILLVFSSCFLAHPASGGTSSKERNTYKKWEIKNGRFYNNGEWVFLKIAKTIRNFADAEAVQQYINNLDILKQKNYNVIELNCYWHHFDKDGDGTPDVSLEPLSRLVDAIYDKGMIPCLSVETYAVGGGQLPAGFWNRYPDAEAINDHGAPVTDTEYKFGSRVVSIFHEGYRLAARRFIRSLVNGIDYRKILYFETTVEPQYMGTINLCYSTHARKAYHTWLKKQGIADSSARMPATFPVPVSFIKNEHWNRFRAQFLAEWVNGDAQAYRDVAGKKAYIAVDYLDAEESSMMSRVGNPEEFLKYLTAPDIIQVNWSWYFPENKPNQKAYDRVRSAMKKYNRKWAITEHMTFNGSDFNHFTDSELRRILQNTLDQGNRFGWEFVSVENNSSYDFAVYYDDWSPRPPMALVDNNWNRWLEQIQYSPIPKIVMY